MPKVCHFTSVHPSNDVRVFLKECVSLSKNNYDVCLVAKGKSRVEQGVNVIGVGDIPNNRIKRIFGFTKKIYKCALQQDCDIYHFHDPELLPYGVKLKRKGKIVFFDSHEDVSAQIIDKTWIPAPFRRLIAKLYRWYETIAVKKLDAVIVATPHIGESFSERAKKVVVVNNYSLVDDISYCDKSFASREQIISFAGRMNKIRGEDVLIEAMKSINGRLLIAGPTETDSIKTGIDKIEYLGESIPRAEVNSLYAKSRAGIVIYQPAKNHYEAQPIKMFEYMAAGLPFVASDFPLWKKIVEDNNCGVCVDPTNPKTVADACNYLLENPEIAQKMGANGRRVMETVYNWSIEEKKLIALYNSFFS